MTLPTILHKRGTTAKHTTYTGLEGEATIDTSKSVFVVHDGTTPGGHPLAREDLSNVSTSTLHAKIGLSTDGTFSGMSDTEIPSEKAIGTFVTDYVAAHAGSSTGSGINDIVNSWRIQGTTGTRQMMHSGYADNLNDLTGIASTSLVYNTNSRCITNAGSADSDYNSVSLLLHGNSLIVDNSPSPSVWVNSGITLDTVNKKYGNAALYGNGASYAVNTSLGQNLLGTGNFTIECDFRFANVSPRQYLFGFGNGGTGDPNIALGVNNGGIELGLHTMGGWLNPSVSISANTWYHSSLIWNGTDVKFYLDGTLRYTRPGTFLVNSSAHYLFGYFYSGDGGMTAVANAQLEELRVTKTVRSVTIPTAEYADSASAILTGDFTTVAVSSVTSPSKISAIIKLKDVNSTGIVLNSAFSCFVSRDSGVTWIPVVLENAGMYATGVYMCAGTAIMSGPAGTTIKCKITSNSTSVLEISGIGLLWS